MPSLILPRSLSILALVGLLAACPAGPEEDTGATVTASESGAMTTAATDDTASPTGTDDTAGTSPGGTDDTAGSATGGGVADCSYAGEPWTFSDALDMPRFRGVGEDNTCNPVTTDTVSLELQLDVPDNVDLGATASVRVLLFEADPDIADASADCVGGLCESLDGTSLTWSFDVPNDQPGFTYYVSVDLDDGNGCILHEVDFVEFSPAQGTLVVPMTASDCI